MTNKLNSWLEKHSPDRKLNLLDPAITIGAAAKIVGLSEAALRKYEAAGLIIYHRSESNYRMLSLEDLQRIELIKYLIKERGLNLEGILRLWALLPCWEFKSCSEKSREKCPALLDSDRPCWVLHSDDKGCDDFKCRTCEVYRFGAYCTEDLKALVHNLTTTANKNIE